MTQSFGTGYLSSIRSYKQTRVDLKNGFLISALIFFKSTISVGLLNNQMYYFSAGWMLGMLNTLAITLLVSYGMVLICDVAYEIEKSKPGVQIDTFESVARYLTPNPKANRIWYAGIGD